MEQEIIKTGLKANTERLIQLLGQSMYSGNIVAIALKELAQNSYDAVKTTLTKKLIEHGLIYIELNREHNSIIVKDNGIGMSAKTVENVYLSIGGTLKDLDISDRSGGLGVAKVQFFATTTRMKVTTVKNGWKTSFDTDISSLFNGETILAIDSTDASNGTEVEFFYPKDKADVSNFWGVPETLDHPLIGHDDDITVTFKRSYYDPERIMTMPKKYTEHIPFNFDWADVDVYFDPLTLPNSGDQQIFSAGLYQFKHDFHKEVLGYLKIDALLNIRPKVTAESNIYPFNLQRQGFKPNDKIKEDLRTIGSYLFDIQFLIRQEQILKEYASMESLEYVKIDATAAPKQQLDRRCPDTFSDAFITKVREAISEMHGSIYEEPQTVKETRLKMTKVEEERSKNISLKYQNKTDGDFSEFSLLFSKVASATLDALTLIPSMLQNQSKTPSVTGVTIDKTECGFLLSGTNKALCINPLKAEDPADQECWVLYMMYVFLHEITHISRSYHDDTFCSEMGKYWQIMMCSGNYDRVAGMYRTIWIQHGPEIVRASKVLKEARRKQSFLQFTGQKWTG